MKRLALISALTVLGIAACSDGTEPTDYGWYPDDMDWQTDPGYEPCVLANVELLPANEFLLDSWNQECTTHICLYYQQATFCTRQCTMDLECEDIGGGTCSIEITNGSPGMIGSYCRPDELL